MSKTEFTLRTGIYPAIAPEHFKGALEGKVAIVTGSGRGIGREIAFAFARSGASVVVTGRTESEVHRTVKDIESEGHGQVIGVVADVCEKAGLESLVRETTSKFAPVDILVCNAGTNTFMPFHMTDPDEWWKQMEIMVKAPTELTRMILPSMKERNSGTIIYTSSRAAAADLPWTAAYGCAKTAITRFAGVLQNELNELQKGIAGFDSNGISVFSIHPGEVKTRLHQTAFPEKTKKEARYVIEHMEKIGRMHPDFKAETPAWTCVYLAAGNGKGLEGRLIDCTRDIEEVKEFVLSTTRPRVTNACA